MIVLNSFTYVISARAQTQHSPNITNPTGPLFLLLTIALPMFYLTATYNPNQSIISISYYRNRSSEPT